MQDRLASELIQFYRDAAGLLPAIREVCNKFDGKVYNKRFPEALEKATGKHIYAEKRYKYIHLSLYHDGAYGYDTLFSLDIDKMQDGKRINASEAIKDAIEKRNQFLKNAADIEKVKENADIIRFQLEQIEKALDGITKDIPYEARDIYGFNAHIRY